MRRPSWRLARGGLAAMALISAATGLGAGDEPRKGQDRPANRLAKETSPYLLLHAHNPVDWYPWGPEAFARARAEGKPIFLSVGYSSCYWCHVMERESFADEAIARALNEHFVCIKVDREERPDVDQVYMTALQILSGGGGWPMSMFLTPDGRPFYGGTYFPPRDRDRMTGFPTVLDAVARAWREDRKEVDTSADRLAEAVRRAVSARARRGRVPLARGLAEGGLARLADQFDPDFGGFGYAPDHPRRPKFPEPVNLVFLLDQHRRGARAPRDGREPLAMVLATLDSMARGGIRDHLAGGYHRYSTDRRWEVPHFEKMLYDNAQLASALVLAFEATGDPRWRREAEATFAFVARTMTAPEGGFFSALDAEAEGEEGQTYVWTRAEVREALGGGDDDRLFARVYGLDGEPNFEGGRYVLREPRPRAEQAEALAMTPEALESRLVPLRAKLLAVRDRRPQPLRDDKVLTSWNGLMIAAYAEGYRVLKEDRYREAAEKAADFLLRTLRTPDGRLLRTFRAGQAKLPAYLEDYAFLAHGLLRLHAATGDARRLDQARGLVDRMVADFADDEEGGFFFTADGHESLLARPKDPYDGALPGANAVAIRALVALAAATGDRSYLDRAGRALDAFSPVLAETPAGAPLMLVALGEYLDARREPVAGLPAPGPSGRPADAPRVVTAEAAPAPKTAVAPGQEFEVTLTVTVAEGWHIYANPAASETLRPTTVTLAEDAPFTLVKVDYPVGEARALTPGDAEKVRVYEGTVTVTARVRAGEALAAGPQTLPLRVRYQACNDRACLAPATLDVPLRLDVGTRREDPGKGPGR